MKRRINLRKWIFIISLIFLLVGMGCVGDIKKETLEAVLSMCTNNGGLSHIRVDSDNSSGNEIIGIYCNDGATYVDVKKRQLP